MGDVAAGWFLDGVTPQRYTAEIRFGDTAIEIETPDHRCWLWLYRDIRIVDHSDQEARFAAGADERLIADVATAILIEARMAAAGVRNPGPTVTQVLIMAAAVVAVSAAVWFGWPPLADSFARTLPERLFYGLGDSAVAEVTSGKRFCESPAGTVALGALVDRLIPHLPPEQNFFLVRVVDSKDVNAFAVPGNQIIIYSGLLNFAKTPEELAGVLAHEIGHIVERHPQRMIVRYSGLALVSMMLWGDSNVAALGSLALTFSYGRGFEAEADVYSVELLDKAGIDNTGLVKFFSALEKIEHGGMLEGGLKYISTHPPTAERRRALEQRPSSGGPALTDRQWRELRAICAG